MAHEELGMRDTGGEPRIAVVVIGRNEGDRLLPCLRSVLETNYPRQLLEVVYVDSDSTDDSVDVARELGVKVVEVSPERPCAAVGRNAGWRAVDAELVMFLDGDTVLDPDFLTNALPALDDKEVAVVFGHRREIDTEGSLYNRTLDLDWVFPLGEVNFCGGDALMRREVLALVDGYDEELIAGEEPDLCRRMRELGHTILHIDVPMTLHDLDMHRFSQYWKRGVRTGHAYAEVAERFRYTDDALWSRESNKALRHAALLVGTPLVAAAASVGLRRAWPMATVGLFWGVVFARTVNRGLWKSPDLTTRTLYAVHSHFQKVPISWGQLVYRAASRRGDRKALIEYK